ncbi:sugar-binding transcriptional regulator [Leucobacter japonicus]|uniref:sugar-binding transcriptional regulator n=1 Tax=Leucobacter japonicus TaxID=1461259 RepID=UPI0006A76A9A|nr:sugar-binding domain-containing protein [Leucobacter japonicus]
MEPGPNRLVEMAHVAREHFINDVPMVELAARTGMSRFRVARLIAEARELGVLRISIGEPQALARDEVAELRRRYGLREIRCVTLPDDGDDPAGLHDALGRTAAEYLESSVRAGEVLGFASGRTLGAIPRHLHALPVCDVVQLTGLSGPPGETAGDLVRAVSAISTGAPAPLYVPLVASDAEAATVLERQTGVAETLARMPEVTRAMLALGSWVPVVSQLVDSITEPEAQALIASGVRADVGASLFDEAGERVSALDDRTIAIPFSVLRSIPEIVVVAGGAEKHAALRAVLRAGFVTTLITDRASALSLLADTHGN